MYQLYAVTVPGSKWTGGGGPGVGTLLFGRCFWIGDIIETHFYQGYEPHLFKMAWSAPDKNDKERNRDIEKNIHGCSNLHLTTL